MELSLWNSGWKSEINMENDNVDDITIGVSKNGSNGIVHMSSNKAIQKSNKHESSRGKLK